MGSKMRGCPFDLTDKFRERECCGQRDEKMRMVINAAKCNYIGAKRRAFSGDGAMDALLEGARQQWKTIPGGPYRMDVNRDACSSHNIPSHSHSSPRRRALRRSP